MISDKLKSYIDIFNFKYQEHSTVTIGIVVAFCLLAYVVGTFLYLPHTMDDAYITFRYGKNLFLSDAWTWDIHQLPGLSYTSFSYAVLSVVPQILAISPALFFKIVGISSSWMIIIYLINKLRDKIISMAAMLLIFTNVSFYYHQSSGMETIFFALLLVLVVGSTVNRLTAWGVILCMLLAFTRPEGCVFVGVIFYSYRKDIFKNPVLLAIIISSTIAYIGFHFFTFGTVVPISFYRKTTTNYSITHLISNVFKARFYLMAIIASAVIISDSLFRKLSLGALLVFFVVYAPSDLMMNIHDRFYWQIFFPLILSALFYLDLIKNRVQKYILLFCFLSLNVSSWDIEKVVEDTNYTKSIEQYHTLAQALKASVKGTILLCDAGRIPYYSDWHSIDYLGLVDRNIAEKGISFSYLSELHPDIILLYANDDHLESIWHDFSQQKIIAEYIAKTNDYEQIGLMRFSYYNIIILGKSKYLEENSTFKQFVTNEFNADDLSVGFDLVNPYSSKYLFE